MRYSFSLFALLSTSAAWAGTIPVSSKVTEVTMYPETAAIIRTASFAIPAGKHRLVLQGVPDTALLEFLHIDLTGARQISTVFRDEYAPPREFTDPRVQEAEARIDEIEQRIQSVKDNAKRASLKAAAADVSIGFLRKLGENEGLADSGPDVLRDISRMISQEAEAASQIALDAEINAREIERQLRDLADELDHAEQALEAIDLESEDRVFIAVDIEAPESTDGTIQLNYLDAGGSFWTPVYDLRLETGDTPQLAIERGAIVRQRTGENWTDVTLHLSTVQPIGQVGPSPLYSQYRRIEEPGPVLMSPPMARNGSAVASMSEPLIEAAMVMEEASSMWSAESDGPGVTYSFGQPVSVSSGADTLRLELDVLTEQGEITARAVPLQDTSAYRVVRFTNTSGEELLPAEYAARYIDGKLVGVESFEGLVAGQEGEIGFGPIEGLRLSRDVLGQSEGGHGIISRSNEQVQKVEIEIENLTDQAWPLQLRDRVPYTEQEDLEITWSATPHPSEENLDKRRGILAWDLAMEPGETRKIRLETTLSWPEGRELR
ncbi:hypothetical protein DL239_04890 [Sedimentitalea sp. CY04]|uniref:Mucoidy inhibitor MuiA family protein n=1 Tax=Parasedimentitalea denitrificans TaxID=2211118 RepID=A0ABX0W4F2_9RHOB|nr:DUF4139 domain-containing protein [Sedimentitalea sp. CY04]NIZ60306.1 hypothetical protein [Sedimentitalea sp. CY04]